MAPTNIAERGDLASHILTTISSRLHTRDLSTLRPRDYYYYRTTTSNLALWIGIAVGVSLLLTIIAIIGVCVIRKKKAKAKAKEIERGRQLQMQFMAERQAQGAAQTGQPMVQTGLEPIDGGFGGQRVGEVPVRY